MNGHIGHNIMRVLPSGLLIVATLFYYLRKPNIEMHNVIHCTVHDTARWSILLLHVVNNRTGVVDKGSSYDALRNMEDWVWNMEYHATVHFKQFSKQTQ